MTKLRISDTLALPPETVTSTLIVYGGKGMGKTNFGSVLVEEMSRAGLHWCALDPMGVWWGLRHSADGSGPGVECLILGGPHGDIPIEPTGGAVVADLVVDEDANVIVDVSRKANGEAWSIGEKVRFVRDFGRQLHKRQSGLIAGKRREPLCVVMDEAARFIPQTIFKTGNKEAPEAECLSVWSSITEEGRNFGIGVVFLTQRSARLNKSVAELADVMVAFRTIGPNSIEAIVDWLGEHKAKKEINQYIETLRSLPKGDALVVSPGWLEFEGIVHIRLRETFDSSATPKPGERAHRVTGNAAKPDLAKYASRMQATIQRQKENDPSELKRKIAELQRELAKKQAAGATKEVKVADQAAIKKAISARDRDWFEAVKKYRADQKKAITASLDSPFVIPAIVAVDIVNEASPRLPVPQTSTRAIQSRVAQPPAGVRKSTAESNGDGGDISTSQRKILAVLAEFRALGFESMAKPRLAAMCEVSSTSGGYFNNLGKLRSLGLIDYRNSEVYLTDAGVSAAPQVDVPVDAEEIIARCKRVLSSSQSAILDELVKIHPRSIAKDDLAERLGVSPTSGGYFNNLGFMRTAGMIDYPAPGTVKLEDWVVLQEVAA